MADKNTKFGTYNLLHQVTQLLQTNDYVAIISLDLSKAFDSVRHSTLANKIATLDIPDHIYNWVVNFLEDRKHVTTFQSLLSAVRSINASVVQGSGIGPSSYIVNASDLHPIHLANKMGKYADDTYLLIGASMRHTVGEEMENVSSWARANNLRLNQSKSREMLIIRRGCVDPPPPPPGVQRVTTLNILGVTITDDLRASSHVGEVLCACSSSLYALRMLKAHGLPTRALHTVAGATTVAKLLYAAPAWWGFTTADDRARVERFLARMRRSGYLPLDSRGAAAMVGDAEDGLLRSVVRCRTHVLRSIFPPTVVRHHDLRPRPHDFVLPLKDDRNYIPRILFRSLMLPR